MDAASPEETARPLREGVLAGRLLGPANAKVAAGLGAFLAGEGDALTLWFGAALAARIAGDAEKLRGLIDRDIAALDALIGAQVDEILHAARLRHRGKSCPARVAPKGRQVPGKAHAASIEALVVYPGKFANEWGISISPCYLKLSSVTVSELQPFAFL